MSARQLFRPAVSAVSKRGMKTWQSPIAAATQKPDYGTYQSPYGPKYKVDPNIDGWTVKSATNLGLTLGAFGGVAGIFAIFFFSDIPKVRKDIMQNIPIIGDRFVKEIPPSDNICYLYMVAFFCYFLFIALRTNRDDTNTAQPF